MVKNSVSISALVQIAKGHFSLESGYHADTWFDLDGLMSHARQVQESAHRLAAKLATHNIEAVCGPLFGGAIVAQNIASFLDLPYFFTERCEHKSPGALFPVDYCLSKSQQSRVRGKLVAVVDDAVSAGSAIRGTVRALQAAGARPVVVGALLLLGDGSASFMASHGLGMEFVEKLDFQLWLPTSCPLCAGQSNPTVPEP